MDTECKVISIVNQKGGVSKTTTASLLAAGLARKGYKVLAIDADSQGNMSSALHADKSDDAFCLADLMQRIKVNDDDGTEREIVPEDAIQHTDYCDVIASNDRTAKAADLFGDEDRLYFLSDLMEILRPKYEFIIFDTGPAKDNMIKNCLVASDGAIIPTISAEYATQGIVAMSDTLRQARRKNLNPRLKLYGILLTKYQRNLNTNKKTFDIVSDCAEAMGTRMFKTLIRTDENVNKSQMAVIPDDLRKFDEETGVILYDFAPKSNAAVDYMEFIEELLTVLEEE